MFFKAGPDERFEQKFHSLVNLKHIFLFKKKKMEKKNYVSFLIFLFDLVVSFEKKEKQYRGKHRAAPKTLRSLLLDVNT